MIFRTGSPDRVRAAVIAAEVEAACFAFDMGDPQTLVGGGVVEAGREKGLCGLVAGENR
jgi:hypothetical protein